MTRASDVAELVLGEIRASTGAAFSGVRYREEPLLFTGAQRPDRTPERIGQMRNLAREAGWHSYAYGGAKLFYDQARFMADFEDDCPYVGQFERYYPTYEDMPNRVLRGYFTWRARYRAGKLEEAPVSFLFVYAYELLCGIGVQPGYGGYRALCRLQDAYGASFRPLALHLSRWCNDYAVYHRLDNVVSKLAEGPAGGDGSHRHAWAVTVLRQAEQDVPAGFQGKASRASAGRALAAWPPAVGGFSQDDVFEALSVASRYRVDRSAALRLHRDELVASCALAFAYLADHCRRRRKEGFVDGAFGKPAESAYRMFSSAVFFDPAPPATAEVDLGWGEGFSCRNGQWFRRFPCRSFDASVELGNLLHAVDAALRGQTGDLPSLKPRETPAFLKKMATQAVEAVLARKAAEGAARVTINRASLAGIRSAAAQTCEALLVDEERDLETPTAADAPAMGADARGASEVPAVPAAPVVPAPSAPPAAPDAAPCGLSPFQVALLEALLAGAACPPVPAGTTLALEVDALNEALYEVLGDVAVEFSGDALHVVEEYRDEVREVLS